MILELLVADCISASSSLLAVVASASMKTAINSNNLNCPCFVLVKSDLYKLKFSNLSSSSVEHNIITENNEVLSLLASGVCV